MNTLWPPHKSRSQLSFGSLFIVIRYSEEEHPDDLSMRVFLHWSVISLWKVPSKAHEPDLIVLDTIRHSLIDFVLYCTLAGTEQSGHACQTTKGFPSTPWTV